ncbi:MAG: hypothetical protein Kapaf2KO_18850 [Candidatus Kapaibacteriales bacterium]
MMNIKNGTLMRKLILSIIVAFAAGTLAYSQDPTVARYGNDEVAKIISDFKNYRYGSVWVYEVTSGEIFKEMIESISGAGANAQQSDASVEQFKTDYPEAYEYTNQAIQSGKIPQQIVRELDDRGLTYDFDLYEKAANAMYLAASNTGPEKTYKVYVVTSEPEGKITAIPEKIYGAVVYSAPFLDMSEDIDENLKGQQEMKNVYSYKRLLDNQTPEAKYIQSKFPIYDNMYELVRAQFQQGNVNSKTMDARSLGNPKDYEFYPEGTLGNAESLMERAYNPTDRDVQVFKRISSGEAMDFNKKYQIIASPDLVSFKMYDQNVRRDRKGQVVIDSSGNIVLDNRFASNDNLPVFGVEAKYGIDNINYFGLWSNRMTVSALWDNMKFGVILPTGGWSVLADEFSQQRGLTTAGFGVNAEIDFPFPLIQNSGVFEASVGYVFGDAEPNSWIDEPNLSNVFSQQQLDQLLQNNNYPGAYNIRFNSQLHYTFAMAIDDDYLLRVGLGGTVYQVESWNYGIDSPSVDNQRPEPTFREIQVPVTESDVDGFSGSSNIYGGVSGKIDFMAQDVDNPYGATLQYLDGQIGYQAWMQFNVIEQTLGFKAALMGYSNAFRDRRPWELDNMFMPTIRAIYTF